MQWIVYKLVAGGVALAVMGGWYYQHGKTEYVRGVADATQAATQRETENQLRQTEQMRIISKAYQDKQQALEQLNAEQDKRIKELIRRPVYAGDCFDADGLREIEQARNPTANRR